MGLAIAGRPDSVGGAPQAGQLLDLVPPQAGVKHGRDGGQQILDGLLHPADVGLRHGIAVRLEAACQLGLGQGFAGFLFIQFPGFLHAQCALDERQAAVQLVFREMARQGNISPRSGHGRNWHAMRKKRSSRVSLQSSRRIARRVLPPLRMM